ncbi:MAG: putative Ig domain-containing protein, partial [Planctomycetota bacterium]
VAPFIVTLNFALTNLPAAGDGFIAAASGAFYAPTAYQFDATTAVVNAYNANKGTNLLFTNGAQKGQVTGIAGTAGQTIKVSPPLPGAPAAAPAADPFVINNLPAGLGFDPGTGIISGTPLPNSVGTYFISLLAVNATGASNATLTLTIAPKTGTPPAITSALTATVAEGAAAGPIYQIKGSNTPTAFSAIPIAQGPLSSPAGSVLASSSTTGTTANWPQQFNFVAAGTSTTAFTTNSPVAGATSITFTVCSAPTAANLGKTIALSSVVGTGIPPVAPFTVTLGAALTVTPAGGDQFTAAVPPTTTTFATSAVLTGLSQIQFTGGTPIGINTVTPGLPPNLPSQYTVTLLTPLAAAPAAGATFTAFTPPPTATTFSTLTPLAVGQTIVFTSGTQIGKQVGVTVAGSPVTVAPALAAAPASGDSFVVTPLRSGVVQPTNGAVLATYPVTNNTVSGAPAPTTTVFTTFSPVATATSITFTTCSAATAANLNQTYTVTVSAPPAPYTVTITPPATFAIAPAGGDRFTANLPPTKAIFATNTQPVGNVIEFTGVTAANIGQVCTITSTPTQGPTGPIAPYTINITSAALPAAPVLNDTFIFPTLTAPTATSFATSIAGQLAPKMNIMFTSGTDKGQSSTITGIVDQTVIVSPAFSAVPAATDAFTANSLPTNLLPVGVGLGFDPTTGIISGSPAPQSNGVYDILIQASNASGSSLVNTLTLTITPPAPPATVPAITSASTAVAISGTLFQYQATATNTPTSFSAAGLPAGLSIDPVSGLISGTPNVAVATIYKVALSASNASGTGSARLTITVEPVAVPPVLFAGTAAGAGFAQNITDNAPVAAKGALISNPRNLALDGSGNVYFDALDYYLNQKIYKYATNQQLSVVAGPVYVNGVPTRPGEGGPAPFAPLNGLGTQVGVPADSSSVLIADTQPPTGASSNTIVRVTNGALATVAGIPGIAGSVNPNGDRTQLQANGAVSPVISRVGQQANAVLLKTPQGVLATSATGFVVADTGNSKVMQVDDTGKVANDVNLDFAPSFLAQLDTTKNVFIAGSTAVTNSAPIILSPATASGTVGQPFTYQIASAGGATTFSSTSILPGWLAFTLDPTTGLTDMLTGTPTIGSDGTFTIQLTVGNVSGNATAPLTITIAPGTGLPAVTSAQIPAVEGVKVIYQITATNNSTPPVGYNAQVAALGVGGQVSDNPPPTATTFATTPLPMPAVGSTIMFTSGKQSGSIVVVASAARNAAFQQTITVTPALAAAPAAGDSFVPTNVVPGVVAGPLSGAVLAGTSTTSFTTNTWLAVGESVLFTGPAASPNLNLTSTIATVTPTITFGFASPPFTITLTGTLPLAATPLAADTFTATPPASTTTTFSVPPAVAAALAANRNILFTGGAQKGQVGQILGIAGSTVTLKAALPAGPGAGDTFIVNDLPAGLGFDYTSGLISGTLAFGTYTGAPSFVNLSAANALGAGHGILELDISRAAPGGTVQASAGGAVAAVAAGNLVMAATAGQAVVAGTSTTSFTTNTANLAVGMNIQFASAGANNLLIRTISAVTGPAPFTITLSTPLTITPVAADTFTPWAGAVTAGISSNVFTTAVTGLAVGMNIQFTSGANNLLIRTITAYTGAAAPFTVTLNSALTATPAAADTFLAPVSSTTVFTTAATGLTKGMNIMFTSGADNGSVGTISAITGSAAPFTITLTAALGAAPADNDTFSAPASTTTSFTTAATGLAPGMLIQFTGPVNNLNAVGTIATVTGTAAPFIITLTAPLVTAPAAADTFNAPVANATTFTTATPLENGTKIVFTKSASGNPPTVNTIAAPVPPAVPCTVTIAPGFANPIVAGDAFVTGDVPKFINIPAALPSGMVNVPYSSFTVQFINAPTLFTASTVATLPPGLTLNTSTGVISGTPTKSGTYNFTITAANLFGPGSNNFTSTIVISQGGLRQIDLTGTTPVVTPFGPPLTGLTGMATGTNGLYVSESNKITLINAAGTPVYVAQDTKRLFDASALASTITGLFASGTTVRYATSEGVIREYTDGTPLAAPAALPVVKAGRFFLLTGTGGPAVQVGFNFKSYTPLGMVKTFQLVGDDGALQYREVDYTTNPISATVLAGAGKNNNPAPTGEGVSATAVTIGTVGGIAVDAKGTVYFSDQGLNTIRMVPAVQNATITTYAGVPNSSGYSGNGLPAKSSLLNGPAGLAFSAAGELYFCESSNCVVRKVSNGNVVLVAGIPCQSGYAGDGYGPTMALFEFPSGLCFDPRGDLFITDSSANVIRVLDAKGIMNTVAGISYGLEVSQAAVPALESDLGYPIAITRDVGGKLYTVGGSSSNTIIRTKGGMCQVVAGMDGASGFNGDGLPGVQTLLNLNYFNPITFQSFTSSVLFVSNLGLVFTDTGNNRVRVLTNLADTTNTPPTAVITVTPTGLLNQVPYKVVLDGSLSTDPDGDIVSYDWDLGDGTTASGSVVDYTYGTPKTYTVTLTVTDSAGNTSKATATIIAAVQVLGSKTNGKGAFKVSFVPAKAGKTSKPSDAFSLSMTNVDALKGAKITSAATITIGTFQQTLSVVVAGKGVATTVAKATPAVKLTVDGVKKDAFSLTIGSATLKPAFDIFVGGPNGINTNTVGASTTVVVPVVISLNNGALILGDNYLFVYKSKYNSGATGKFSQ